MWHTVGVKAKGSVRWTSVLIGALTLFLAGLGLARFFVLQNPTYSVICGALLAICVLVFSRRRFVFYVCFLLLLFVAGWWRGATFTNQLLVYEEAYYQERTYLVTATEDAVYSDRGQLTFVAGDISLGMQKLPGTINIEGVGVPAVYAGDRLEVSGSLRPARGLSQGWLNYAQVTVLQRSNSPINILRREFAAGLQNALPEPLASFGLGLLIGQRNTLNDTVNEELIAVGLIHIVAVSGYNLTVITHMSQKLFARFSRYQALAVSLFVIAIFLLFTGYSPSIVRAAVVSVLGLFSWYFGRRIRPLLLLLLSAVLTAGVNPLYLWSSVGWYLSFTAFFGVLILAPPLHARFWPKKWKDKLLPGVVTETFAAQVCTLPIILFIFGRLSVISIVANLLVVPLTPFAMLASLLAGIGGMIGPFAATLLAWPARILLDYMLSVSSLLSRIPFANVGMSITLKQMVLLYVLITAVTYTVTRKNKPKERK